MLLHWIAALAAPAAFRSAGDRRAGGAAGAASCAPAGDRTGDRLSAAASTNRNDFLTRIVHPHRFLEAASLFSPWDAGSVAAIYLISGRGTGPSRRKTGPDGVMSAIIMRKNEGG